MVVVAVFVVVVVVDVVVLGVVVVAGKSNQFLDITNKEIKAMGKQ